MNEIYNPNPKILKTAGKRGARAPSDLWDLGEERTGRFGLYDDPSVADSIDQNEVFDLVRFITDPEHKHMTLEELMVVSAPQCSVSNETNRVQIEFTPTVPHCGMSTVIGLTLRVRLLRALPDRFKVDIRVKPGSHQSENELNKQLNDKERVAAALENSALLTVLEECLEPAQNRVGRCTNQ
ncbi:hypothetical protein BJ322DRAFT_1028066 [Thelephora terrestris]|uniref:MIP18 family-like domain-containing protein n=1 Tax=Thelephora terrestris TaxID=56493 RepID=A0A9P6HP88_9AGAM|nr:hypothetical protein BJ322DRAFT_1028066 [Thelephora terrestris]